MGERLLAFATKVVVGTSKMGRTAASRYFAGQLMRSAASAGANYQEACAAESRADFVHKMQVVLKELRESLYWLSLDARSGVPLADGDSLSREADELVRICVASIRTAKSRSK